MHKRNYGKAAKKPKYISERKQKKIDSKKKQIRIKVHVVFFWRLIQMGQKNVFVGTLNLQKTPGSLFKWIPIWGYLWVYKAGSFIHLKVRFFGQV